MKKTSVVALAGALTLLGTQAAVAGNAEKPVCPDNTQCETQAKSAEGACGEGKCGAEAVKPKAAEGACGEGKCGAEPVKPKAAEGKCGEGKCGG